MGNEIICMNQWCKYHFFDACKIGNIVLNNEGKCTTFEEEEPDH